MDCSGSIPGTSTIAGTVQWRSDMLAAHNFVRACATPTPVPALPALTWNTAAELIAQNWANNCLFAHNTNRGNYGENIYAGTGAPSPSGIIGLFASESANYHLATNSCDVGQVCGHYTQLVWRNTTSVGCAQATCHGGQFSGTWYFVVCDYAPPGNYVGQSPY